MRSSDGRPSCTLPQLASNEAVEWIDAAWGIAAAGPSRLRPVLGLAARKDDDYTNTSCRESPPLMIDPGKVPVCELLNNALLAHDDRAFRLVLRGIRFPDWPRATRVAGIFIESKREPWDFCWTLEGAVAWASGLYRRQG